MRRNWFCPQNPPPLCLAWNIIVWLSFGLISCGCQKIESDRVCLVSSLPRTGVSRQVSDEVVRGIRLAIEEVKAKAGRFTLEYRDLEPPLSPVVFFTGGRAGSSVRQFSGYFVSGLHTKAEIEAHYGGTGEWDAAPQDAFNVLRRYNISMGTKKLTHKEWKMIISTISSETPCLSKYRLRQWQNHDGGSLVFSPSFQG